MNSQLINGVMIDWDKINRDSYLRDIDAISHVDHIHAGCTDAAKAALVVIAVIMAG